MQFLGPVGQCWCGNLGFEVDMKRKRLLVLFVVSSCGVPVDEVGGWEGDEAIQLCPFQSLWLHRRRPDSVSSPSVKQLEQPVGCLPVLSLGFGVARSRIVLVGFGGHTCARTHL